MYILAVFWPFSFWGHQQPPIQQFCYVIKSYWIDMLFCIILYQNNIPFSVYGSGMLRQSELVFAYSFHQKAKLIIRGMLVALNYVLNGTTLNFCHNTLKKDLGHFLLCYKRIKSKSWDTCNWVFILFCKCKDLAFSLSNRFDARHWVNGNWPTSLLSLYTGMYSVGN